MHYEFDAVIKKIPHIDGAYVEIPFDVHEVFGERRVKVEATADGLPFNGMLVRMGLPHYILGMRRDIQQALGKKPGDTVRMMLKPRS